MSCLLCVVCGVFLFPFFSFFFSALFGVGCVLMDARCVLSSISCRSSSVVR